ncbi:MAG TPA: PP2C family serine/threonine-protein phosphatase [Vicinamibacterales bacterium]
MDAGPRHRAAPRTPQGFSEPVTIDAAGLSHKGYVRKANEDHFLIARAGRYFETVETSLPAGEVPDRVEEAGYSLLVADGMGGHVGGELASRLVLSEIVKLALALPDWIVRVEESTSRAAAERAQRRVVQLNAAVIERGKQDPALRGMGSTLTAARNLGRMLQIAHVGDSRAYLLRQGSLHRLTRDHTYVQMLVDTGQMTPEEALASRSRHVLTNAIGGFNEDVLVDVERLPLENGDRLLLCSDGLTDFVDDEAIRAELSAARNATDACRALVDRALAAGGRDNVTVVVACYSWPSAD